MPLAMIAMAGVVLALLVFAGLLLAGGVIVRWLGLATDLPDGPRFEPPAPPLVDHAAPEQARSIAAVTHRRAALGSIARECLLQARALHDQRSLTPVQMEALFQAAHAVEMAWTMADLDTAERTVGEAQQAFRALLPPSGGTP